MEINGDTLEKHLEVVRARPFHDAPTTPVYQEDGMVSPMDARKIILPMTAAMHAEPKIAVECTYSTIFDGQACFPASVCCRNPCTVRVITKAGQEYSQFKFASTVNDVSFVIN